MDEPTIDIESARRGLERRVSELTDRVSRISTDLRSRHDDDSAERAVEIENDEVLEQLEVAEREELARLRIALDRIRQGRYGKCSACGASIAAARLAALPHADRCARCAT